MRRGRPEAEGPRFRDGNRGKLPLATHRSVSPTLCGPLKSRLPTLERVLSDPTPDHVVLLVSAFGAAVLGSRQLARTRGFPPTLLAIARQAVVKSLPHERPPEGRS